MVTQSLARGRSIKTIQTAMTQPSYAYFSLFCEEVLHFLMYLCRGRLASCMDFGKSSSNLKKTFKSGGSKTVEDKAVGVKCKSKSYS